MILKIIETNVEKCKKKEKREETFRFKYRSTRSTRTILEISRAFERGTRN